MQEGVSFAKLDLEAGERFVRLRGELGIESFGLNLLVLEPGQRGRIHRHKRQEEAYIVLEGALTLEIEDEQVHTLTRGDAARVAPGVRRRLSNHSA
jgi:quercetin dioxygenase-like cupin family protein